jgi:hypothetical protein
MTQMEHLVRKLPNDIGGDAAGPIERVEHERATMRPVLSTIHAAWLAPPQSRPA